MSKPVVLTKGQRVRLKGFSSKGIPIEGKLGTLREFIPLMGVWTVSVVYSDGPEIDIKVFASQCHPLKPIPPRRRLWIRPSHMDHLEAGQAWAVPLLSPALASPDDIEFVEVRKR
jgi:hypothetical protein